MTWIRTVSGAIVELRHPHPDTLKIEDIAHALSNICRFNGHTDRFYSVAEHSVLASHQVTNAKFALAALMHDAAEAYLGDVTRPLKKMAGRRYANMESLFDSTLALKFRYDYPFPNEVIWVDNDLLETEYIQLLGMEAFPLKVGTRLKFDLEGWLPKVAERRFLDRYDELAGQQDFDFGPALANALIGMKEAMAKPLYYDCRVCGKRHKVGVYPHGARGGTKKRPADGSGRGSKLPRGKGKPTVRGRRRPGT